MISKNFTDLENIAEDSLRGSITQAGSSTKTRPAQLLPVQHGLRKTKIEWADSTWNPMIGCSRASEECDHCYAETLAREMQERGIAKYAEGFTPKFLPRMLGEPSNLLNPTLIFVNSMGDLFHQAFTLEQIQSVIQVIHDTPQHVYICLTKRQERLLQLNDKISWPNNLIMGVSIGTNRWVKRADYLRKCSAKHKVISAEPLLEALPDLDLTGIDWCITGGESGPGARPFEPQWAEDIRQMCLKTGTAFFHKQHGGVQKHRTGRRLFGQIYSEYPQVIQNMRR